MKRIKYVCLTVVLTLAVCAAWSNATPSEISGTQVGGATCNCSGNIDKACSTFSGADPACSAQFKVPRCLADGVPTSVCTKTGDGQCNTSCNVKPDKQRCG